MLAKSGSLAGPVLTTVIKTKSVLKDNKWITATEKNFIYYRDQTKRPEISKTYNTTTYTNSQQFGSEGSEFMQIRLFKLYVYTF